MRALVIILFSLLASAASPTMARELTIEEKLSDLNQLSSMIASGYGPLHYKAESRGIQLAEVLASYANKVRATQSNAEFYYLVMQFIAEFKDSHFGASVPTTHIASLPFSTDLVQGKVLIDQISRAKLPESVFPFERGDEIIAVNGTPVSQAVDELQKHVPAGYELTARRSAAQALTSRSGTRFPVPSGIVSFSIRRGTSNVIQEVSLKWAHFGTPLDEFIPSMLSSRAAFRRDYDDLSLGDAERSFRCSGGTRIEIPKDATVIMMNPFVAYYFPTAKGNVGYLRIPHYSPAGPSGEREDDLRFSQYEYAVSVLEQNTVGLIIDQDHNCGGSVAWLHRMVSLFIQNPVKALDFTLLGDKQEYMDFKSWVDSSNPFTLEHQGLLKVCSLIENAWTQGEFMTPKTPIDGIESIQPNTISYSKPIVMTIDEMSGSGGDAFPALMQGHGRAKLVGTRTMGAGGHVVVQPALFYSRITPRMTKSLFYRPDGVAVENNGAEPDYPYEITRDDFMYGYQGYLAFSVSKLLEQAR